MKLRSILTVHFEPVEFTVCLDQLGPLLQTKDEGHAAVFWQSVFGSGDFVEQYPDRAKDKYAYMVAGLESALRSYEIILPKNPKSRLPLLDELVKVRNDGRLIDFVKKHPCDEK